jgi:hypothetical protein
MAIPTITGVEPTGGLTTGGNVVRLSGTNFKLPDAPAPTGMLGGDQQKTVSVKFGGQESEWAYSASDQLILARVPEYRGAYDVTYPVALDVRVANLDTDGIEIPGENVTYVGLYQVDRQGLATESYLQRVIRAFQQIFKRHVLQNTFVLISRDAASDLLDDNRLQAEAPSLYLTNMSITRNRFYSINRESEIENQTDPDRWFRTKFPVTVDIEFTLTIVAKSAMQLFNLCQSCMLMFREITDVRITDDPSDDPVAPTGNYKDYEIRMPWEFPISAEGNVSESDLHISTAGVSIIGVHIDKESGTIVERGWDVTANDGLPVVGVQPS